MRYVKKSGVWLFLFFSVMLSVKAEAASKKIAFFGDSITWGHDGSYDTEHQVELPFPAVIQSNYQCVCDNYGYPSLGFMSQEDLGRQAYQVLTEIPLEDYDAIVIALGYNDILFPVGTWDSTDESTVMGQYHKCIQYIQETAPNCRIVIVSVWNSMKTDYPGFEKVRDAIRTAAGNQGLPFIEQTDNPLTQKGYTIEDVPDGTHPCSKAYLTIGSWLGLKLMPILELERRNPIPITDVEFQYSELEYQNGELVEQPDGITVKAVFTNQTLILSEGEDYTVTYLCSRNAEIAIVIITGRGNFTGRIMKAFRVVPSPGVSGEEQEPLG